jgi:hypothetical protein
MLRRIVFSVIIASIIPTVGFTTPTSWIDVARKVGQSESEQVRSKALAELRKQKNLDQKLIAALDTEDRALALEAIANLELKTLVPELQKRVASDKDGFLTLTLSSLLDEKNKDGILKGYTELLKSKKYSKLSPAVVVAELEPLGRIGIELPIKFVGELFKHPYPEVRASTLLYIRAMALTHKKRQYNSFVSKQLKANDYHLRLQAAALAKELKESGAK